MIKSMTGYGSAKGTADGLEISVEMKSVNNRFLDVSVRMPKSFIFAEETLKSLVAKSITRGKVDVFITIDSSKSEDIIITVNEPMVAAYKNAFAEIAKKFYLPCELDAAVLSRLSDIFRVERRELDRESVAAGLSGVLTEALELFGQMRSREGDKLRDDILEHVAMIEELLQKIEQRAPTLLDEYRDKLMQRMREVLETVDIDEQRIMSEAAVYADRSGVDEETVRLRSHLSQLREMINSGSPIGRKLDFLLQEVNRETNTIGSKCADLELTRVVVDIKAETEKIREQIQNVE